MNLIEGISSVIFQLFGIYFIGGVWLLLYVSYQIGIVGNVKNKLRRSRKIEISDFLDDRYMNLKNYHKSVFVSWIVTMISLFINL